MPTTKTDNFTITHNKMDVAFMNEHVLPIETLSRKSVFIEAQLEKLQNSPDAELEVFEKWLAARVETMSKTNEAADKLFRETIKEVVEGEEKLVLDDLGIDKRYFIIMELITAMQIPEGEEKNLSTESDGTSTQQS